MLGTKTSEKSWMARSRSANKMADRRQPTERAPAFHGLQRGRPSARVRACAKRESPAARRRRRASSRLLAPGARKTAQPHARNQNERKVLDGQIAISQ